MTADRRPWSHAEVEAAVAAYLEMLIFELAGRPFNKAERRRTLRRLLDGRSESAIERKHQNISAVLLELGSPYVEGYKPLRNYQRLLWDVVAERVRAMPELQRAVQSTIDEPVADPAVADILSAWTAAPEPRERSRYTRDRPPPRVQAVDWLQREAANAALGAAGERFVLAYEQARLIAARRERLASRIEHVSRTRGDGAGYDILSFDADGRERLIEVKTTGFGAYTPFHVTRNEVAVSREARERYHLYRVFGFRRGPRLFGVNGALDQVCVLDPTAFVGRVG
jgi:hypothetical protein